MSPYLTLLNPLTEINDQMYEWIPQQVMSLLRCSDSPRYVIYSYGQTLKPAADGFYGRSPYVGMITNYQVVSEVATRAVVRFESMPTNVLATNVVNEIVGGTNTITVTNWFTVPSMTNNRVVIERTWAVQFDRDSNVCPGCDK